MAPQKGTSAQQVFYGPNEASGLSRQGYKPRQPVQLRTIGFYQEALNMETTHASAD